MNEGTPAEGKRFALFVGRRQISPLVLTAVVAVVVLAIGGGYVVGQALQGGGHSDSAAAVKQVAGSSQSDSLYPGATVASPEQRPDLTFTDTADQRYNIASRTASQVTLLYFGYTNCPNLCPINMALAARALQLMPAKERSKVTVLFVTIDPRRDTLPVIRAWLDKFNPKFVGLRGTTAEVHRAEAAVGQPLSYVEGSATGDYQFEHAGVVLAYGRNAPSYLQFDISETPSQYATSLEHLVTYGYRA